MAEIETHDVMSVGSRVSWGAVVAGAVTALTLCVFLAVLGAALGLTIVDRTDARPENVATGAGIWTIVSLLIALFVGGFVTSRVTVGERKGEAMMYGVLVWGALVALMAAIGSAGTSSYLGFGQYLSQASNTMSQPRVQRGFTPDEVRAVFPNASEEQVRRLSRGAPEAEVSAPAAAWWAFAGIGFSLFAAIAGALVGAGPELVLRHWTGRGVVTTPPPHS